MGWGGQDEQAIHGALSSLIVNVLTQEADKASAEASRLERVAQAREDGRLAALDLKLTDSVDLCEATPHRQRPMTPGPKRRDQMDWKAQVLTPSKLTFKSCANTGETQKTATAPCNHAAVTTPVTKSSPAPVTKSWLVHLGKRKVLATAAPAVKASPGGPAKISEATGAMRSGGILYIIYLHQCLG